METTNHIAFYVRVRLNISLLLSLQILYTLALWNTRYIGTPRICQTVKRKNVIVDDVFGRQEGNLLEKLFAENGRCTRSQSGNDR